MREILFRGKQIDTGVWVEGFFCNENCDSVFSLMYEQANIIKKGTGYWYSVIPNTVGQYTGLTDKNGKRIFEGDIVKGKDTLLKGLEIFGYIDHQDGTFVIVGDLMRHYRWLDYEVEVIGNIHDNSELMKGENNV